MRGHCNSTLALANLHKSNLERFLLTKGLSVDNQLSHRLPLLDGRGSDAQQSRDHEGAVGALILGTGPKAS